MNRAPGYRAAFAILSIWIFATYWNIDKAFHIDDAGHLEIARWIAVSPLHPMSGWVNWSGNFEPISQLNQPHLYYYLMAGWGEVFGYTEIALHSLLAIFTLWAIAAFYRLAMMFEPKYAIHVTALFGLSSAFVVGQNSMVDVPLLAIWLEFYCTLLNPAKANNKKYLIATLICSAALLVKYTSLVLVPALALQILFTRDCKKLLWVLVPVCVIVLWSIFNFYDYGGVHILGRPAGIKAPLNYLINVIGWVATLGAIMPFAVLIFAAKLKVDGGGLRKFIWSSIGLVSLLAPAIVGVSFFADLPVLSMNLALFFSFFTTGGGVLFVVYGSIRSIFLGLKLDATNTLLMYWIASTAAFVIVLAPFMATRHVLLALPAVVLLLYQQLVTLTRITKIYLFALALTVSNSALLAKADHWYANIYKKMAPAIMEEIPRGSETWFLGHWGWQWYAQQSGMRQWAPNGDQPEVGDYLVIPLNVDGGDVPNNFDLIEVKEIVIHRMDWYQHYATINLYISAWLPWGYSNDPMERIKIYRITKVKL